MEYQLSCEDMGMEDCDFVATGKTQKEVIANMQKHHKTVYKMSKDEVNSKEMVKMMKDNIQKI